MLLTFQSLYFSFLLSALLVSYDCGDKVPILEDLKQKKIYSPTVLKDQSFRSLGKHVLSLPCAGSPKHSPSAGTLFQSLPPSLQDSFPQISSYSAYKPFQICRRSLRAKIRGTQVGLSSPPPPFWNTVSEEL